MTLPSWVSPSGLLDHLIAGIALVICFGSLHYTPTQALVNVLAIAITHEIGDKDLLPGAQGWPWNGLLDVVAFLPYPILYRLTVHA